MLNKRSLLIENFKQARREASYEDFLGRMTGKPTSLLSYEDVKRKLRAVETAHVEIKDIPLDAIVGSVGRYMDFTRSFLPRLDSDIERWISVLHGIEEMKILPPIEVYQVGSAYFVLDGNHRVSVARRIGAATIQAYVRQVKTRVPFTPEESLEDLINKAEHAEFLEKTRLSELRPETSFQTTLPGRHLMLLQQIEVVHFLMEMERGTAVPYEEAVLKWHDEVYLELVQIIRRRKALDAFPGRTETDLFTWLVEYSTALGRELGWQVQPHTIVPELIAHFKDPDENLASRLWDVFLSLVSVGQDSNRVGSWREERLAEYSGRLFADILVVGLPQVEWAALGSALYIAENENSRVLGLYVQPGTEPLSQTAFQSVEASFEKICASTQVTRKVVFQQGPLLDGLKSRLDFVDLAVIPYQEQGLFRVETHRSIVRQARVPVLFIPGNPHPPRRCLVIYNNRPRAQEALFLAAYLYSFWGIELVIGVLSGGEAVEEYLAEHKIPAELEKITRQPGKTLQALAERCKCDLLLISGTKDRVDPWLESLVMALKLPVLICS